MNLSTTGRIAGLLGLFSLGALHCKTTGGKQASAANEHQSFDISRADVEGKIKPPAQAAKAQLERMGQEIRELSELDGEIATLDSLESFQEIAGRYSDQSRKALNAMQNSLTNIRPLLVQLKGHFDNPQNFAGTQTERTTLSSQEFREKVLVALEALLGQPQQQIPGQLNKVTQDIVKLQNSITRLSQMTNPQWLKGQLQTIQNSETQQLFSSASIAQATLAGVVEYISSWTFHRGTVIKSMDFVLDCSMSNYVVYNGDAAGRFVACDVGYTAFLVDSIMKRAYDSATVSLDTVRIDTAGYHAHIDDPQYNLIFNMALSTGGAWKQPSVSRKATVTVNASQDFEFFEKSTPYSSTQPFNPKYTNCHAAREAYFRSCVKAVAAAVPLDGSSLAGKSEVAVGGYCSIPTCDRNDTIGVATATGELKLISIKFGSPLTDDPPLIDVSGPQGGGIQ